LYATWVETSLRDEVFVDEGGSRALWRPPCSAVQGCVLGGNTPRPPCQLSLKLSLPHHPYRSSGRLHHFAWRAGEPRFCQYVSKGDERYLTWTTEDCSTRECLEAQAKAGLVVDVGAVKALLMDKLPRVLRGASVEELREPWPPA